MYIIFLSFNIFDLFLRHTLYFKASLEIRCCVSLQTLKISRLTCQQGEDFFRIRFQVDEYEVATDSGGVAYCQIKIRLVFRQIRNTYQRLELGDSRRYCSIQSL